jgi:hypothetical protein
MGAVQVHVGTAALGCPAEQSSASLLLKFELAQSDVEGYVALAGDRTAGAAVPTRTCYSIPEPMG